MAISDAQYAAWLAADNKERVVLVEAEAFSAGSAVTRYMSNRGFVSTPGDSPANTAYDDIVIELPGIRSAMADVLRGRSLVSFGDLDIDNSGGLRDSWLLDAWDGRSLRIFLGDASWPKADFRQLFNGVAEDIQARDNATLTLRLRDRQRLLDVPMQTTFVGGSGSAVFQRIPIGYGEVKFAEPVLIDAATNTYQLHDGQIQSIDAVYIDGAATAAYTADLANGKLSLAAAPTGRVTVDFKGSKTGGVYVSSTSAIVQRIVQERAGWSTSDIDAASASQFATDAPGVVGIYVTEDHRTVLNVLDELITGAGGYYTIDRDGKLVMGLFKAPAGTPAVTLVDDDIEQGGIELLRREVPVKSVRIGYARYFTLLDTTALTGLSASARQRMADEYLIARATTGSTNYLLAQHGDIQPSCYVNSSDATSEATRQAALWGVLRRVFRVSGFMAAQRVRLGDVIGLDFSRYGLSGGVPAVVVGLQESLTSGSMELEVFL